MLQFIRAASLCIMATATAMPAFAQHQRPPDAPRPIEAETSLWTEELTSMEIRDAVRGGTTTIIIGTGGIEQNGPYVATGKHNYVLQTVLPYLARAIGNALIAPIVKFVPEGSIEPRRATCSTRARSVSKRLHSKLCSPIFAGAMKHTGL